MKKLLVILLLAGCGSNQNNSVTSPTSPPNTQPCPLSWTPTVIHSFGDSITWGTGATTPCEGYQAELTNYLFYTNDNEGVPGSLMTTLHYQQMMSVQESPTDINTVLSGFNDITDFGSDPTHLALFIQDLTDAITRLSNISSLVAVGSPLNIPSWALTIYNNQLSLHTTSNVQMYCNAIQQVITTLNLPNVIYVDLNSVYDPDTMASEDGEHPSNYGHGIIAQAFYAAIYNYQKENL